MRRKTGRIPFEFERISTLAADLVASGDVLIDVGGMELSRKSACYRRKDGSLTICLIWKGAGSLRVTYTLRGVRL